MTPDPSLTLTLKLGHYCDCVLTGMRPDPLAPNPDCPKCHGTGAEPQALADIKAFEDEAYCAGRAYGAHVALEHIADLALDLRKRYTSDDAAGVPWGRGGPRAVSGESSFPFVGVQTKSTPLSEEDVSELFNKETPDNAR